MALVTRLTKSGKYIVLGSFDEVTKISDEGGGGGDANLGFNTSSYSGSASFPPFVTFTFSSSGSCSLDEGESGSGGTWYTGVATGSNFEIQFEMTSSTGSSDTFWSHLTSGTLSLNTPTSWLNLSTNAILFKDESGSGLTGTADVTVRIREVAVPTNITTATFTLSIT